MRFRDRTDAGRQLAGRLAGRVHGDVVVLALPRGGVPVAAPVARALGAPLDVVLVRKLGVPFHPEFAMGAIGEGGVRVLDREVVRRLAISQRAIDQVEERERRELERRADRYRRGRPREPLAGRTVVLVDDGVATGSTAAAACESVRRQGADRVVVAAPVASPDAVELLRELADDVVCVLIPSGFRAVGEHYDDFSQTSDEEVCSVLDALAGAAVGGEVTDTEGARGDGNTVGRSA